MAVIDLNYYSPALKKQTTVKVVLPMTSFNEQAPFKTLYLLHGVMGDHTNWLTYTRITRLAEKFQMAVVMPNGENSFYVDNPNTGANFGQFIGEELVNETRKIFPLSDKRANTYIAGLSMGGYGALRNGLKYNETFGAAIGLSSAILKERIINSTNDDEWLFGKRSFYEATFGPIDQFSGSDMDLEALIKQLKDTKRNLPKLFFVCGTEDFLLTANQKFHHFLTQENIPHYYNESKGNHEWTYWDEQVEVALRWLRKEFREN